MRLPAPSALVSIKTPVDQGDAFHFTVPVNLGSIFTGWGPLPAVTETTDHTGAWDTVGQTRTVWLSDGSYAQERLTGYRSPLHFTYTVTPQTGMLSLLVREARGAWWFLPDSGGGTEIWWQYDFHPRTPWAWLPLAFISVLWQAYMKRALHLLVRQLEK